MVRGVCGNVMNSARRAGACWCVLNLFAPHDSLGVSAVKRFGIDSHPLQPVVEADVQSELEDRRYESYGYPFRVTTRHTPVRLPEVIINNICLSRTLEAAPYGMAVDDTL
jgi:hypothetical protein